MTAQTPSAPPSDSSSPIPAVSPAITRVVPMSQRRIDWLVRFAALVIAGGIVFLFATHWDRWVGDAARQTINDAFVQGDLTLLSSQVDEYASEVPIDDFQYGKKRDLLVAIEAARRGPLPARRRLSNGTCRRCGIEM